MKQSIKSQRVSSLILKELNDIIFSTFKDAFEETLVTVTQVELSTDLSIAKAHVSIVGGDEKEIVGILNDNKSLIKKKLGNLISKKVRRIPDLKFKWDNSVDRSFVINKIIKEIGEDDTDEPVDFDG